jgi:hypothetical protein
MQINKNQYLKSMNKGIYLLVIAVTFFISCGSETKVESDKRKNDSLAVKPDTAVKAAEETIMTDCTNDSLDELAKMIAGIDYSANAKVLGDLFKSPGFKDHASNFEKKWMQFDTSRLAKLKEFRTKEIFPNIGETKTLFYPFSGPDILYGYTFFPDADKYILMGLEPVGTRPVYDEPVEERDSMNRYYKKINTSLHAILKFSFFRTAAMKVDLKNEEEDGTMHLLLLFLARTGNKICEVNPVYIDSTGALQYIASFTALKSSHHLNKGVEIKFYSPDKKQKTLYYYSLNLANSGLKPNNKGMMKYLDNLGEVNTYLKGASYLMHKDYFSIVREAIFKHSKHVVQDDSGIAFHYFLDDAKWDYKFYGRYLRPIPMFSQFYQKDLDSLYKVQGSTDIGFGIGYNFKDKNSNFMIATRK